ncbi:ABC transporter ATP-binding protein [Sporolactobacillus laevolacticus]|uniref:ABC transporter ATP-binding protein n=1 Tax=Sporolactobacillus laevolacticus TaxID=33018 RepID=UPI0025B3D08E|nr:ABC transporter ATP-binding protein [Sporolactobacillus laevolacticus]MDN3953827.1 ABC transporter ATP-binding protein [Sporolactobacillus laevolacticus]
MSYLHIYWKKYRFKFLMAIFFLSLEALADLLQPALMSKIVDQGVAYSNLSFIERYGLLMLLITLIGAVCACTRNILSVIVSQKFAQDLRQDLYIKIQSLSQTQIDRFGNATLITRLTNDVTRVQTFANGMMRIMMKAPLVGIGSLIMAVHLNPRLSLILLGVAPIIALLIFANMKVSYPYFRKVQHALDHVNRSMQDYLSGIRVVKVFNRSVYEQERFNKNNQVLGRLSATASKIGSLFGPLINLTVNFGVITILWFGGIGVNNGSMHVGSIIAFTNYMMQLLFAIMMVNNAFSMLVRARASSERIGEVMNIEPDMSFPNRQSSDMVIDHRGSLQFEHVDFSFPSGNEHRRPVLTDIHFSVLPGETIGIIGPIASGKSTVANLILRFYDPDQGAILLGGKDIKKYSEEQLRKKVAIVPQHSLLFSGSVIENIRWGNENASDEEVIEAAKIADADTFVRKLSHGYEAMIGQGGVNLSGGQKQRLSIARALIRKPEILILDDATSAVDAQTDKRIRNRLKQAIQGLTCIMISQKVSSIMDADRILALNQGRIEAMGKHDELLAKSPFYRTVCDLQLAKGERSRG